MIGAEPPIMVMRHLLPTVFLLALSSAHADTLAGLNDALSGFTGSAPVRAHVEFDYWNRGGDKDAVAEESCTVGVDIEEDSTGLRILWSRETLAAAEEEMRVASTDPDLRMPMRRAIAELSAAELSGYLNGRVELQRWLGQSELVKEEPADWKGAPTTLLTLKNTPRVNAQTRKYLKELTSTVRVWIGADGAPLAAERKVRFRGRALLVVSFESSESDAFEYAVRDRRLVVTRHAQESNGSGTGGTNHQKTVATLTIAAE
jgi:hypothetical protein